MLNKLRKLMLTGLVACALPLSAMAADEEKKVEPGAPVTITVKTAEAEGPGATLGLLGRQASVTPCRKNCARTGGGNIIVTQPAADTVVILMTGAACATGAPVGDSVASLTFDLSQCLEVAFADKDVKMAKLSIEGKMVGFLRSHCKGCATAADGVASIACEANGLATLNVPGASVGGGQNLSINNAEGPESIDVCAGKLTLHVHWMVSASHPCSVVPVKAASAEFAPEPAIDPLWLPHKEPFHGADKVPTGLEITIKVAPTDPAEAHVVPAPIIINPQAPPVPLTIPATNGMSRR